MILTEYRQLLRRSGRSTPWCAASTTSPPRLPTAPRSLLLNAGLSADTEISLNHLADGVGLYRTEIPFMLQDSFPSEWEQTARYRGILETYRDRPVCMRTLDVGDKQLPYFPSWRKIPSLVGGDPAHPGSPRALPGSAQGHAAGQRRAGQSAIMLPMISSVSEIKASRRLLDQAWREVSEEAASRDAVIRYPSLG